jgi:hypothetical protein
MSKFLEVCEKVQKHLREQGENADMSGAVPGNVAPGATIPDTAGAPTVDPNSASELKVVTNDQIKTFVAAMKDFYQSGNAMSGDAVDEINKLPSTATDEDIAKIVEVLTRIFQQTNLPKDSSETDS